MKDYTLKELLNTLPQQGIVEWIGLRPARRQSMISVQQAQLSPDFGIEGDRYSGRSGKRQVTLIQAEHLEAIASFLERAACEPSLLRRNIVVRGINLLALKDQRFLLGDITLEYTGLCHPCSRMEETFGPGGYNAVRGHGGINARVLQGGTLNVGDRLSLSKES